ncbi:MAG: hypothetical protein ABIU96_12800 [Rhodanobacter sp.]
MIDLRDQPVEDRVEDNQRDPEADFDRPPPALELMEAEVRPFVHAAILRKPMPKASRPVPAAPPSVTMIDLSVT